MLVIALRSAKPCDNAGAGNPLPWFALADRALKRLHHRWWPLAHHGKSTQKATTAVAREMAGFVWAILHTIRR